MSIIKQLQDDAMESLNVTVHCRLTEVGHDIFIQLQPAICCIMIQDGYVAVPLFKGQPTNSDDGSQNSEWLSDQLMHQ